MILTCPACATSYFVPDNAIGANGRRVRCKSCGHDWRASLEDEPLELTPASDSDAKPADDRSSEPLPETLAEASAPELPRAYRAKAEQKRRMRKAATLGAIWVGTVIAVVAATVALVLYRLPVVQAWPQTASLYKAVGFPVNIAGVEVEALRGKSLVNLPDRVIVGGALRNIRDHEVVPPALIIILRDDRDVEVVRQPLQLDGPPILPGKVQGFAAVVDNPEGKGIKISVEFALEGDAVTATSKSPVKTEAKPRPLPEADEKLRQAAPIVEEANTPAPVDSEPH